MSPHDLIRAALQNLLNAEGDCWLLDDFVLVLGLQRINSDGQVESTAWVWSPMEQADYKTDGLLSAALELRCDTDID